MICPNYKIKEVFDGFNEIIEALGGKPMTEEEFRSSELRNQRTGRDYSAMEAAYKMYHRNNGNMPDVAPNGEHSILFDSLLEHFNGDRKEAIKAKSNVYSDEFFNWFGNWIIPATPELAEDENISSGEVSKVVDENGEPLVVWHGSESLFSEFQTRERKHDIGVYGKGFYFTSNKNTADNYGNHTYLYPVFLNIKEPYSAQEDFLDNFGNFDSVAEAIEHYKKEGFAEEELNETDFGNLDSADGVIVNSVSENFNEVVVKNPNQIKHVKNLGTFSTEDDNIYQHVNEDDILRNIREYIEDYIKNKFGYGNSYKDIKKKVQELEKQLGVLEVKVMKDKKLNFDNMHFDGQPISRREEISRIQGTDVYNAVITLVNSINRLFPNLKISVKEDFGITPGSAYYDQFTNTIHYRPITSGNLKSVNRQDIVEECLHPLIACIAATDPELFNKLLQQAKQDKGLVSYINNAYKYKSQAIINQEIVTQAIARMYANNTYANILSIDEFQQQEHNRRFTGIISLIKEWVNKIKNLIVGNKILVKNSDFSTVISSLESVVDILNTKDIEFTEVNNRYMIDNMWHTPSGSTASIDQIRKSAEDIRHRFGVLYKAYQKMPNKSTSRQKLANEIFEVYNEIKRLDNFEAVTKALEFARKKLGLTDDSSVRGVLQWLQNNESDNFARVSAEQIVDVMQNSIGFFENLLTYFPSDCYMTEEARQSRAVVTDGIRNKIRPLWVKAVYAIGDRIVDELVDRWFTGQDEDRAGMKEVAKDWLHKNAMYSDISNIAAFLQNYQYSENPITKQVFHLIQVADTKTGIELQPIAAKVTKAYSKANRGKLSPSWQKIFMEFDKDGIPTGNFVRDINYGQYQKDVDEFITNLNKEFQDKYGHSYYIDEDGTYINSLTGGFADDEVWNGNIPPHIIEYKLAIEEFKCSRANRRYTFEYYKERMSEPYSGPDPLLTNTTGEFKHGLSPRTLSRYERIQSNINYYMSLCYNKEDGKSHPEDLSPEDWVKLEQWRQYLDDLSNPYNEDGSTKTGEDYQTAIEIRAWEKWIGQKLDTQVDMESFEAEAQKILTEKGPVAYDKFIKYNSRVGINPNLISQTIKQFGVTDMYADAVHARLLRTSLQRLVNSKHGYGRDLGKQAKNPQFWQECRRTDQLIEDCKTKRGRDFAEMMEKTFANDLIEYRDAYGNAYDYFGRVVPRGQEKNTNLLTWYDYMVNSYVSEIMSSPTRTIEGLYDGSGNLIVFSGSEADVKAAVKQFFTYRRSRTQADGTVKIERVPLSIFSLLTPLQDTFVNQNTGKTEKSITNIPSGRFSNKADQTGKYLTDPTVFDNSSHIAEQPKREYYDNSDAFNAMSDDERALYDILVEICTDIQKLYRQNSAHFNWRLPMINAQSMALLSRLKSDGFAKVSRAIFDSITTVEENDENVRTAEQFATNPDGTIATDVPLKFVHPLKDMSRLSTDVASMVILFAEMGLNYKNKQEIDDKIKALRYNLNFDVRNEMELDEDEVSPNEGKNSVQQFDNMTNIHMYGNDWHFKTDKDEPYERHIIAAQKATRWLQRYETTHMLGLNILSMLVGACDAGIKQFREVLNGKYARPQDMVKGLCRCIEHTPMVIKNINNPLANNKLTALMQMFRISKGTRATYEHMNWGRLKKLGAQFLMGGFSMLDYMMNGLLLMTHMSNVRLYEGDSQVPKGFYTLYELQQQFVKTGRTKFEATLKHLMLHEDLYNAFEFVSGEGVCVIKPKYQPYITDDTLTMIRTKTLSRGALYNGMNPDNDQPQARKKVWSAMALSMRGWLTQAYQHLMSGGTDNIAINRDKIEDTTTRYGITKKSVQYKKRSITNEERSRRQAWNYETGTPQDQIFVGLYRGFGTLYKYIVTNAFRNIPEGDPRKVKFSDVEKYAAKDAIIYLATLGLMLATWPIVNSTAAAAPPPDKDETKLLDNPYDYIMNVYIPNQYWKLQAADIYFRTIESSISSVDPTTALDFITSLTVLKSGFDEQLGLIKIAGDLTGLSGHDISEILERGGYKYYTRGQRALAKGFGFPDNIHTAFDYYGLYSNMDFYLSKYGGIYKFWGYDWREEWKKDKKPKKHIEGGPQAGPKKSKKGNFGPGPSKKQKKNNSGMLF